MSRHGKISDSKIHLSVVVPKEVKAELKLLAKKEGRSLSNFVVLFLARLVEERKQAAKKSQSSGP